MSCGRFVAVDQVECINSFYPRQAEVRCHPHRRPVVSFFFRPGVCLRCSYSIPSEKQSACNTVPIKPLSICLSVCQTRLPRCFLVFLSSPLLSSVGSFSAVFICTHTHQVYRDKCFPIDGTTVGERDCVIFECEDTEGQCPPQEYPMCDG